MQKVAALQISARTGNVKYNLDHVKELALDAAKQGAKVISVPEFFTTSIVLDDCVYDCIMPPENPALDMLIEIATDKKVLIGGSYLEKRDDDVYNCYTLVRPDGTVTRHDKDRPTMIENAFYIGGSTDGVHKTVFGNVGTAVCWELIRTDTTKRLMGNVDFTMTGTHWWTVPLNWKFLNNHYQKSHEINRVLFQATPSRFAKILGVPNIHASHCGKLKGKLPLLPMRLGDVSWESQLMGQTQIVDNDGNVVKSLNYEDGPGIAIAEIELTPKTPSEQMPDRFWIPELTAETRFTWWQQNFVSKAIYNKAKKAGKF